jgi:all-trans-8'-apo-beta-carotenal 15,15'-oxygenase
VIDLSAKTMRSDVTFDLSCEFPRVHPSVEGREHGVAWVAHGDLGGIARLDIKSGKVSEHRLPAHQRGSEPVFAARPGGKGEDDGWLLVLCADAKTDHSFVAVYDAARIPDGPVARVWFEHMIPITFHGIWMSAR